MANDRPNMLLVVFDSLSAQDLNRHIGDLPTLRGLADHSLNFTNAYASSPESSPARASLFTGLDFAAHGLWTDGVALPRRETPFPEVFAAQGYQSWLVGRRHLAGVSNWTTEHARAHEYHQFDWAHGPLHRSRQNSYLAWLETVAPETYAGIFPRQADPDATELPDGQRQKMATLPDDQSFNAWVGQQTLSRMGETPFCGIVGFVVGQSMGGGAATLDTLDWRALQQADAALGKILRATPRNTVIAVTSGRGSVTDVKTTDPLQESAIKVPLMIRLPDGAARVVSQVVSTMDIAPTFYERAGITAPQKIQGSNLISATPRGWAMSRLRHPSIAHQTALICDGWKIIRTHGASDAFRLFDLKTDPNENRDLSQLPEHQGDLETMLDLMIDVRVALEDRTEPRIAKF